MFPDHVFVRCDIDAIDLIVGHVALEPLDLRPEILQHAARFLRDPLVLFQRGLSGSRELTLCICLGHIFVGLSWLMPAPFWDLGTKSEIKGLKLVENFEIKGVGCTFMKTCLRIRFTGIKPGRSSEFLLVKENLT